MKPYLSVEKLTQRFPDGTGGELTVFENASFRVEKGEFVVILGHSGCGKSTIMNILAGLAEPTSGVVKMDGFEVSGPSLDRGVVFQNYSLLPWLSALKNVTFGVAARYKDWSKAQVEEHARKYLAQVGLEGDVVHRKPSQLSGGMRQRVSIARAFANQPKLLLLDEPFGALDAFTREDLWQTMRDLRRAEPFTAVLITHDLRESVFLGDQVIVLSGRPARTQYVMEIDLPEDRGLDSLYTPKVADMLHILRDQIKIAQGRDEEVH